MAGLVIKPRHLPWLFFPLQNLAPLVKDSYVVFMISHKELRTALPVAKLLGDGLSLHFVPQAVKSNLSLIVFIKGQLQPQLVHTNPSSEFMLTLYHKLLFLANNK